MEKTLMKNERLYFRSPNINVCFKASVSGLISNQRFEEATEAIVIKHPILSCAIELDSNNQAWYLPGKATIKTEFLESDAPSAWLEWYEQADSKAFDFEKGPLARIAVIRNKDRADIIILGHHILGDGVGYLNLMRDYLAALDGCPAGPPLELPADKIYHDRKPLNIIARVLAKYLNWSWRKNSQSYSADDYQNLFESYRRQYPPSLFNGCLEGEELKSLLTLCQISGTTVNEALATAFLEALRGSGYNNFRGPIRFGVAISIRDEMMLSAAGMMGNFVSGIAVKATYDEKESFSENLKTIASLLRVRISKKRYEVVKFLQLIDNDFLDSVFFSAYGGRNQPAGRKLAKLLGEGLPDKGIGFSNLGRQEFKNFNNFSLDDIQFIPPAFPANLLNIGIITANDRLNFCLRYSETDIPAKLVKEISNRVVSRFKQPAQEQ